jgi:hypothetical protein
VPLTVTPLETSGVGLLLAEQIRKEYWVFAVSPVTTWLVPAIPVKLGLEQSVGALAPDWYFTW